MKKNLIAIIALTAALAASTSAFADTVFFTWKCKDEKTVRRRT